MSGFSFSPGHLGRIVLGVFSGGRHSETELTPIGQTFELEAQWKAEAGRDSVGQLEAFWEPDAHRKNPMDILPVEVFEEVLAYLNVRDLKACRLVCSVWSQSTYHLLLQRTRLFQNVFQVKEPEAERLGVNLGLHGLPLSHHTLRLTGFMFSRVPLPLYFNHWLNSTTMTSVRSLELGDSQLRLNQLLRLLSVFTNLEALTFGRGFLIPLTSGGVDELTEEGVVPNSQKVGQQVLSRIRVLRLHSHQPSPFDLLSHLVACLGTCFVGLRELDLKGNCGAPTFQLGATLARIFTANRNTLKVLRLDAHLLRTSLDSALLSSDSWERQQLPNEFRSFLHQIDVCGWLQCNLDLMELSLERFGVAAMDDGAVESVLFPFLRSLTHLRKLSLANAYFFGDEAAGAERLLNHLPPTCRLCLTSTHVFDHTASPKDFDQLIHTNNNIRNYQATSVEVRFEQMTWRILYCTWKSLLDQPLLLKWAFVLTHFTMTQAQFELGDPDIQYLIRECPQLSQLHFRNCDLSNLTDFGLTGLSKAALHRAHVDPINTNVFNETDLVGVSLCSLAHLRSLTLSHLGGKVSNLSISVVFTNLPRLQQLTIHQWPMTISSAALSHLLRQRKHLDLDYRQTSSPNA